MMKQFTASALLMLIVAQLAACGGTAASADTSASETTPAETTAASFDPQIEAKDYGGAEFRIGTVRINGYEWNTNDLTAESENGEQLNDEIFKRNSRISEKYNLLLNTEIVGTQDEVKSAVSKAVAAGDATFDAVDNGLSSNMYHAVSGELMDLGSVPHLDLTKPYYNQQMTSDLMIGGKNFLAVGNLNVQAAFASGIVYFNKQMAADNQLDDPYQLVEDGKWTLEKMAELSRSVYSDLNGNNEYDELDQYGLTYNNFAWQILFYGSGEKFVKQDSDGDLYFDRENPRLTDILQYMIPLGHEKDTVLYSENFKHIGGNYRVTVCQNAFNEGRALFWLEAMYGVPTLRNMERDFGILPTPKFEETQEKYSCFVHPNNATSIVIPLTCADPDRAGRVIEDLMYDSDAVQDAFVETTLKGKYARDNESAAMIDLIMGAITADYALTLNNSGLSIDSSIRTLMNKGDTNIASFFDKNYSSWQAALDKINNG